MGKTKRLKKQVKVRSIKKKRDDILAGAVLGGKAALNTGDGFYGQFPDGGRKPGGWHRERLKANPFIRPAFKATRNKANATAVKVIAAETNKELKKR